MSNDYLWQMRNIANSLGSINTGGTMLANSSDGTLRDYRQYYHPGQIMPPQIHFFHDQQEAYGYTTWHNSESAFGQMNTEDCNGDPGSVPLSEVVESCKKLSGDEIRERVKLFI